MCAKKSKKASDVYRKTKVYNYIFLSIDTRSLDVSFTERTLITQWFVLLKIIPFAHRKLSNINRKFQKASACSQISELEVLYDLALNPKDV